MLGHPFPLTDQSEFRLVWIASTAGTVSVIAMIQRQGRDSPEPVEVFNDTHVGDRTVETIVVATGGGILWGISATITAGVKRSQAYITLDVGKFGKFFSLAKGYVYDGHAVQDGEFTEPGPGGGEGFIRTVTGTNPAAGVEVTETVPTNALWKLRSFSVVLVTSGVANRTVFLAADDGTATNRLWIREVNEDVQADAQTRTHLLGRGNDGTFLGGGQLTDTQTVNVHNAIPADDPYLPEAHRLRTITVNLQAGDDFAAPIFQVEEWLVI